MKHPFYTAGAVFFASTFAAIAQDAEGPFTYEFSIEVQSDFNFDSDDPDAEINDTFLTIEGALGYAFNNGGSVNTSLVFEPLADPTGDRFLDLGDHGLYVEELFYAQDIGLGGVELVLGKFNPVFGIAWDAAPGIYGVDFAEDYEITEKLGAGVNFPVGESISVQLAAFTADRTILSDSLGESRGQLSLGDGGVSNTSGPESFTASLTGEAGDLSVTTSFQYQAKGSTDTHDQIGVALGATQAINDIELLGELVYFSDFDGTANEAYYLTVGASVPIGPVSVSAVYSMRDVETMPTDNLFTVSGEIELIDGFTASLGYRFGDEGGVDTQTVGLLLAYGF
ncbi:MAG: hypothetical protein AAF681_07355 [Pseudomonadota bacterium]